MNEPREPLPSLTGEGRGAVPEGRWENSAVQETDTPLVVVGYAKTFPSGNGLLNCLHAPLLRPVVCGPGGGGAVRSGRHLRHQRLQSAKAGGQGTLLYGWPDRRHDGRRMSGSGNPDPGPPRVDDARAREVRSAARP